MHILCNVIGSIHKVMCEYLLNFINYKVKLGHSSLCPDHIIYLFGVSSMSSSYCPIPYSDG